MNGRFDGRNVIVTGGGRGIGRATAGAFAAEGADVLVLGRTAARPRGDGGADHRRGRPGVAAHMRRA